MTSLSSLRCALLLCALSFLQAHGWVISCHATPPQNPRTCSVYSGSAPAVSTVSRELGSSRDTRYVQQEKSIKLQHPPGQQIKMVSSHFDKKAVKKHRSDFGSRVTEGWEVRWILPGVATVSIWALRVTLSQAMPLLVGFSPAAPEQAWVGDSNSFCWLSSDP